jgi:hypothetical protein
MSQIAVFFASFNTSNWIAVFAAIIAVVSCSFAGANYLAGREERKRRTFEVTPTIKATINSTVYPHHWRSVQLHIVASPGQDQNFKYDHWHIERAQLLRPRSAVLARAENDDYATGVFYPETPVRALVGKAEGRPQRFALEFFIKFKGEEEPKMARFKVSFAHVVQRRRYTVRVWAKVPSRVVPITVAPTSQPQNGPEASHAS